MTANIVEEKAVATPGRKEDSVSVDALEKYEAIPDSNVENFESQPNFDLSNPKRQPNEEGLDFDALINGDELGTLPDHESGNFEKPLNNHPENSEPLTNNHASNAEASKNSQPFNYDVLTTDESANSKAPFDYEDFEALPINEADSFEIPISNEDMMPETQPIGDVLVYVIQRSNNVVVAETLPNHEVVVSEIQQSSGMVMSEIQQSNEVVMPETQPNDEANILETQTFGFDDMVMLEAISENELDNPSTGANNQLSHSEIFADNELVDFDMILEDQQPKPESLPYSKAAPNSEPLIDDHMTDIKPIPQNNLNHLEAFSNDHLANSEGLSQEELSNSQTLTPHYDAQENNEAMHNNKLVSSQEDTKLPVSDAPSKDEITNAETPLTLSDEDYAPETQPSKRRKNRSEVWEHFTMVAVNPGCRRAHCNQCSQSFSYSTGSKVVGTSHLKRHIAKGSCSTVARNREPNQSNPDALNSRVSGATNASERPIRCNRSTSTPSTIFFEDHCRREISRMIIRHDYPLHMVEHPGFVAFVKDLKPQFTRETFNTIQGDCIATYLMEKQNLNKYFEGLRGRVCLTLDTWTSNQSLGYVFITGHFIDNDWKLQRRILNVVMEPFPDSDSALFHAVAACMGNDWSMLKGGVFSFTYNQLVNGAAFEKLRPLLFVKNTDIVNGQLLLCKCIARTFSSIAKDLLGLAEELIRKIRDNVKYVKTSARNEEKFMNLKQLLQVPSERILFIDDQSHWNTTYEMLVAASDLKQVFSCLDTFDPEYKGAPSMEEWKVVDTVSKYLKPLYNAANLLTTTTHPILVTIFIEVWRLKLVVGRGVKSEDHFIAYINKIIHEKIDKYWRDCGLVLALAVVMDPRFKMKFVKFSFPEIYGKDAQVYLKIVDDGIHELFHEYVALAPTYDAEEGNATTDGNDNKEVSSPQEDTLLSNNSLTDFDAYVMKTTSHDMKSELDQYLEESLLPRATEFDVLGWWKVNTVKYPTLSNMARDILSIPVAAVQPDGVFNTKNKEMDCYRSSLRPEVVEALVCTKDWMQYEEAEEV